MITSVRFRAVAGVLAAASVLAILAGSLAWRLRASAPAGTTATLPHQAWTTPPTPAPATVPAPRAFTLADVPRPSCWSCPEAQARPVAPMLDLDMVAPLGDGTSNLATWLAEFSGPGGSRFRDSYRDRRESIKLLGVPASVLPGDDPLLAEAEPWLDQATCRYYPDVYPLGGAKAPVADMLLPMTLAKSFVARGLASPDPEAARADFRRAVRLGRLLRQDDVTIIQDLIGIACERLGLEALYENAQAEGDAKATTVYAAALADVAGQRYRTGLGATTLRILGHARRTMFGVDLGVDDASSEAVLEMAAHHPSRRFRLETLPDLQALAHAGTSSQRAMASKALDTLATDADPAVAAAAAATRAASFDPADVLAAAAHDG